MFHNWPDKYCIRILKGLIPALQPGAKIVLQEPYMPPALTMTPGLERHNRDFDLHMMTFFNSRDREAHEWAELFELADSRFKFIGVRTPNVNVAGIPKEALLGFIEAEWTG